MGSTRLGWGTVLRGKPRHNCKRAFAPRLEGVDIVPVWNKSNREHVTIGSEPVQSREAVDAAVKALHWKKPYFLDADHIRLETVDRFLPHCNFYTIDVADWIGRPAPPEAVRRFLRPSPGIVQRR